MPDLSFYLDEDTAPTRTSKFAVPLIEAGISVVSHLEVHPNGVDDEVWLSYCGHQGLVALTRNKEIRFQEMQKLAILASGARVFFLMGKARHSIIAINVVRTIEKITRTAESEPAPFIGKIHLPAPSYGAPGEKVGRVEVYRTFEQLKDEVGHLL